MFNSIVDSTSIPLLEQLARFGEMRQSAFAGNIANIDTPNYKPRDLPVDAFQKALAEAVAARKSGGEPGVTSSMSVSAAAKPMAELFPETLFQAVEAAPTDITFQDGGNRSIEREVMAMTKNSMMQSFAIELMTSQMNLMQAMIAERA
jgi:flagellar basal-body rod protein FlgB